MPLALFVLLSLLCFAVGFALPWIRMRRRVQARIEQRVREEMERQMAEELMRRLREGDLSQRVQDVASEVAREHGHAEGAPGRKER